MQDSFEQHQPLLQVLWQLDVARLLAWVAPDAAVTPVHAKAPPEDPTALQLLAAAEVLTWPRYLHDAMLCSAVVALLQGLNWEPGLDQDADGAATFYPGLLQLLAHPDSGVRAKVRWVERGSVS